MSNLKIGKSDRVKGKDVYGKMMTLVRTQPKQLSLFQTFLPEDRRQIFEHDRPL